MSNPNPTITTISALAASSHRLYARARQTTALASITPSIRALSTLLKHLKIESDDPDSVLNSPRAPVYLRQLTPALEDCDFYLHQLGTVLDRHEKGTLVAGGEADDVLAVVRRRLEEQRVEVGLFLDTVQLRGSAGRGDVPVDEGVGGEDMNPGAVGAGGGGEGAWNLDEIKDKVDAIAKKIFARRDSGLGDDDENILWEKFRDELVREGFAPEVLRKHKVRKKSGSPHVVPPRHKLLYRLLSSSLLGANSANSSSLVPRTS